MTPDDLDRLRSSLAALGRGWTPDDVAVALRRLGLVVSDQLVVQALDTLRRTSVGAGPLDELLALDGVTDVLVNGADSVWIDRGAGLELTDVSFTDEDEVRQLAVRLAASTGRRLDEATPWVDARMPDGVRVHAVLSTLSDPGTCISLRVPARRSFGFEELVAAGSLTPLAERVLREVIVRRVPFLVTGGTGSGKTTLLSALLGLVDPGERVVVIEDSRELSPRHPHVIRLEGRAANAEGAGRVSLTDLVRQSLRMRPDRVVLGEVRGPELVDLLMAMNTGHEGGCGTVHANSVADLPARLEALAALGGLGRDACHAQVASALRVVVHVARVGGLRRVAEIGVLRRTGGLVEVASGLVVDEEGAESTASGWAELAAMCGIARFAQVAA
ncbi:TadA family conjugal transfer-associated ATPase [Aestuariimicrobium kwangyangense]|uniref:TadA family conjugal transfer-associated ATPase n=1 Tax=Aestuariimicrobium kwangyangense TaxID=396389 RepID=UPI0003B42980|nr:TadA family conjugal transfer-associated ATPase [Aestuariimicrobium kwangyangense]